MTKHGSVRKHEKKDLTLRSDHGWESEEGYKIFVADRGAVRFDFPKDWIVKFKEKSVSFHDLEPTDDTGALEMSFNRLPLTIGVHFLKSTSTSFR